MENPAASGVRELPRRLGSLQSWWEGFAIVLKGTRPVIGVLFRLV